MLIKLFISDFFWIFFLVLGTNKILKIFGGDPIFFSHESFSWVEIRLDN